MSRSPIVVRDAVPEDVPWLAEVWGEVLRRGGPDVRAADLYEVLAGVSQDPGKRLLIAEYGGRRAGCTHLVTTTISALNLEPVVHILFPYVDPAFRRHGVGRRLVEAGACFADQRGIGLVATASASHSREANRFMARWGFGPQATVRMATAQAVKAKTQAAGELLAPRPARPRSGRQASLVVAARRSMRRDPRSVG